MNPFEKAEQARPGAFKFQEEQARSKYENARNPRGNVFIFANPRSGGTLLTRLLSQACWTTGYSEYDIDVYRGLSLLMKTYKNNSMFGSMSLLEERGVFMDTLKSQSEEAFDNMTKFHVKAILYGKQRGYHKTSIAGWNNEHADMICDMVRRLHEDGDPVKIVWLTRNTDDIIKSFQTKDGPGKQTAIDSPFILESLVEKQKQQFKELSELGDVILKYEDLIQDPIKHLLRMKPSYYPVDHIVDKVMNKVIR